MDKSSMTLGYLVGRQIAGQRRTQEKQPLGYLSNFGNIYPKFPEWDREKYPYAYFNSLVGSVLYVSSEPFVDGNSYTVLKCTLQHRQHGHSYWGDWEEYAIENVYSSAYISLIEPTPVYSPCVVFEKELETEIQFDYDDFPWRYMRTHNSFAIGDKVRVTVNGVAGEYTVKQIDKYVGVGNGWLSGWADEDDGGDWGMIFSNSMLLYDRESTFFTRTPGTYTVKIEWLSKATD